MKICHLQNRPELASLIADRCWHQWWTDSDVTLADYQSAIEDMVTRGRVPSAFVAHQGGTYLGSVLLIEDDLTARPALTPWIAALWVEPKFRRHGIALKLMIRARAEAEGLGYKVCYLNATDANSPYYEARGFQRIESDVDGVNVFSISASN